MTDKKPIQTQRLFMIISTPCFTLFMGIRNEYYCLIVFQYPCKSVNEALVMMVLMHSYISNSGSFSTSSCSSTHSDLLNSSVLFHIMIHVPPEQWAALSRYSNKVSENRLHIREA